MCYYGVGLKPVNLDALPLPPSSSAAFATFATAAFPPPALLHLPACALHRLARRDCIRAGTQRRAEHTAPTLTPLLACAQRPSPTCQWWAGMTLRTNITPPHPPPNNRHPCARAPTSPPVAGTFARPTPTPCRMTDGGNRRCAAGHCRVFEPYHTRHCRDAVAVDEGGRWDVPRNTPGAFRAPFVVIRWNTAPHSHLPAAHSLPAPPAPHPHALHCPSPPCHHTHTPRYPYPFTAHYLPHIHDGYRLRQVPRWVLVAGQLVVDLRVADHSGRATKNVPPPHHPPPPPRTPYPHHTCLDWRGSTFTAAG